MAPRTPSPLLAVLLVTSSSRGASLTFQYPRRPKVEKRYSQVRYHVDEEEKDQFMLHEDEMEDEFDSDVELSEEEDEIADSDSDASDMLELDDERSDWESSLNRREYEVSSSAGGTGTGIGAAMRGGPAAKDQQAKRLKAYQQYLGYDSEILASILAPKRELCHRKFELVIDDLAFVGHPVCVDKDGHWDIETQPVSRGRDQKKKAEVGGYKIGTDSVDEQLTTSSDKSSLKAPMTMFHFVLVLDRPDPSPYLPSLDLTFWLQIFYDNIAFKTTAAFFAEEIRCEYISHESDKLGLLRDRCIDDAQSYASFLTQQLHYSSLARSLQQIYSSISLSANAFITVNDTIDVHLQLPPILHDPARMMRLADIETPIDPNDAVYSRGLSAGPVDVADLIFEEWTRTTGPFLLPWKTLLLLTGEEDAEQDGEADEMSHLDMAAGQQIDSWARKFTSLLKPTLEGIPTFAELADLLEWSLEDDVYPMVRHLIYYREARVIDVPRIQNYYAISPIFDLSSLPSLSTSWSIKFPTLPPLASFLARLSSALKPFSMQCSKDQKQLCLEALVWLLRHQVVLQMHVRLRLIARESAKIRAAEVRKVERIRVKGQREKRLARRAEADKKRRTEEKQTTPTVLQSFTFSLSAPANIIEAGEERGRLRDRSMSPLGKEPSQRQQHRDYIPVVASALSATRPDQSYSPRNTPASSAITPSSLSSVASLTEKVEELKFERRPVLRSRSPSRVLASAASASGKPSSIRTRSSSSRPTTPRGRGTTTGQSRERSANLVVEVLQQNFQQPQSAPAPAALRRQKSRQSPREGRGSNASRSPSRARMRVTGFGEGEEVYVEHESPATDAAAAANRGASDETALQEMIEDGRRLSRVGEEVEGDASVLFNTKEGDSFPSPASEDGSQGGVTSNQEDADLEEEVEVEAWETNPTASIITEPSRAGGEENEWIAIMVEGRPPWLAQRLFNLLPFLNGKHTIDEIVYRLDWRRKDLRAILVAFKDEILTLVHP